MQGVQLRDVTVRVRRQTLVKNLSFTASPGRVHALLGRNGAGKSTTFKAILGLVPYEGDINLLGQSANNQSLTCIGASINGPAFYGHLSARDNVRLHTKIFGLPDKEADRVIALVGLDGVGKKRSKTFSTGMKARLALALALVGTPPILILDEPQNGLDPQGITQLRELLKRYAQAGNTVIVSSHQLGEVAKMADDITVIEEGRVVLSGSTEELVQGGDLEKIFLSVTGKRQ